jgi:cell division protein FtsL
MKRLAGTSLVALATAVLLAALSLVSSRQSKSLETMETLDQLRRERSLEAAERDELQRRIHALESRGRVISEAQQRLGLKIPRAGETVYLEGEES